MRNDLKLIAASDLNCGIGKNGELLVHISDDLKRFRRLTKGGTVVYGRKTLETFPAKKPLQKRNNLILSRNTELTVEDAVIVHSVEELSYELAGTEGNIWVIGGASIYEQLLDYCSEAYITRIYEQLDADAYVCDFLHSVEWMLVEASEIYQEGDIRYRFERYERNKSQ